MNATTFWERFSFDYQLDSPKLTKDLISVEAYRQAAMSIVLAPEWRTQLDRLNRIRAVHGTTALEGNPLSEAEVSHQMDLVDREEGLLGGTPTKEQMQIRNAARAQSWVKDRFTPGAPPVGLGDILTMHMMITERSDEYRNVPGQLRSSPVVVGSPDLGGVHRGVPYEELPERMEQFIEFVNSNRLLDVHPVIRALLAHFFLVTIHPFGDGNGRVSRLLEAGILFRDDYNVHGFYGLSNFFYKSKDEYILSLQESRKDHPFNVTPFISFGVKGFVAELAGINNFIKTKINRVMYRQMLVSSFSRHVSERRRLLNQREYSLLIYLLQETEPLDPFSDDPSRKVGMSELLDSGYVRGAYRDVTRRTFTRELMRLHDLAFIKFDRGKPGETIVELNLGAIARYQIS